MRFNLFKLFWSVYLIEFIIPIVLIIHYIYGYTFDLLIKVPSILYYFLVIIFHFRNRLILNPLTILFLVFGLFSFGLGLIKGNPIDGKFISHIYFSSIPILGVSFGYHFANSYDDKLRLFFFRIINFAFYITCIILIIYFYFHFVTKSIPYWGFGTDMHLLIPFILLQGKFALVIVGILFVVLSGKRATLLNVILELIMYFSHLFKSFSFKSYPKILLLSTLFLYGFYFAYNQGAFSRFEASFQFDLSNDEAMMYATSGRWQEITGIFEYHNSSPVNWFIGAGFGGRYEWYIPLDDYLELKHYAHFAPFAYIFLFGVPFTILLYFFFIFYIFKARSYLSNPFMIAFVVGVFSSFFGANLFVDIKIWVFFGVVYNIYRNPNSKIANSEIKNI